MIKLNRNVNIFEKFSVLIFGLFKLKHTKSVIFLKLLEKYQAKNMLIVRRN